MSTTDPTNGISSPADAYLGAYLPQALDAKQADETLESIIHGKWNYYMVKVGDPTTQEALDAIRLAIYQDMQAEGTPATHALIEQTTGGFITGQLSVSAMVDNALPSLTKWAGIGILALAVVYIAPGMLGRYAKGRA